MARSQSINLEVLRRVFDELAAVVRRHDNAGLERLIRLVLPSFREDAPAVAQPPRQAAEPVAAPLWLGAADDPRPGFLGQS